MFASKRAVFGCAALTCCACVVAARAVNGDKQREAREPFAPPRNEAELRWLMDQSDAQRFRFIEESADEPQTQIQPGFTWPKDAAPELRRIQKELGGSAIDEFPSLSDSARRSASPAAAHQRHVVESLRMAAAQLDEIANRLERFELYRRADDLREHAQRLRLDARGMHGAQNQTPPPANPWQQIGPRADSATEPQPLLPDNPQNQTVPQLQPTPSPE